MRKPRIPAKEQYQLIMQCRQSGLSDHQWCLEHDIHPGTFYNWVRRLRQNPDLIIPERTEPQTLWNFPFMALLCGFLMEQILSCLFICCLH